MKPGLLLLGLAVLAVLLLGIVAVVGAQGDDPAPPEDEAEVTADEVNAIAKQLYCPVCENIPLDVCGTQACADWRAEIRSMLQDGRSEDDIKAYFVERYGKRVLATPSISGIDVVVWVAPIVAVAGGIAVVIATLRRMAPDVLTETITRDVVRSVPVESDEDADYLRRVEDELREYLGEPTQG